MSLLNVQRKKPRAHKNQSTYKMRFTVVLVFIVVVVLIVVVSDCQSNSIDIDNMDYDWADTYETTPFKFKDRFVKLFQKESANGTYAKIPYHFTKTLTMSKSDRHFHYFRKWPNHKSTLTVKQLNANDNRFRVFMFYGGRQLEGTEGEPFDPTAHFTTVYEFGDVGSPASQTINDITRGLSDTTERNIYLVVERVNCTNCPHAILLTMQIHKSVGPIVASLLGLIFFLLIAGMISFAICCRC
jgi:hypothetical protein